MSIIDTIKGAPSFIFQKSEKTKTVVVISPNPKDGKTTLIETLCGRQLEWYPYNVQGDYICNLSRINYGNSSIVIVEASEITNGTSDNWPELANLLQTVDLILHVIDSSKKLVLSDLDDFFETKIDGHYLNEIVESKRLVIFTKSDMEKEYDVWWNSLTKDEQDELNRKNASEGNPRFNTWYEGLVNDWNLCCGLWLMSFGNEDNIYEVSCKNMGGIQKLRERIIDILGLE
ncbi:MAG: GTPase domain-containing protein [Prevotella sp.]|nr:GTPase domain-containing protein [Prevotella sp.]